MADPDFSKITERPEKELSPLPKGAIPVHGIIRTPAGQSITPLHHVQKLVDGIDAHTGEDSFGTYFGHDPEADMAVDCFHAVGDNRLADAICEYIRVNHVRFGVWYWISRQRIWNPEILDGWRDMADRGSNTQNHFDHVHVSFYATAPGPLDDQQEDDMFSDSDRKILGDVNEVLNNTEVGVLRRVADVESGIQNVFLTFQRVEATLARIEQHQNEIPPPQGQ